MEGLTIVRTSVTPKACLDILTTALEAGIYGTGSWASISGVKRTKKGLIREATLTDMEDDKRQEYVVKAEEMAKAVGQILRDPVKVEADGWGARLVLEDSPDGPLADVIVQVACFGKVIYG